MVVPQLHSVLIQAGSRSPQCHCTATTQQHNEKCYKGWRNNSENKHKITCAYYHTHYLPVTWRNREEQREICQLHTTVLQFSSIPKNPTQHHISQLSYSLPYPHLGYCHIYTLWNNSPPTKALRVIV